MAKIEIYSWATCPYCARAKSLFNSKGVSYTVHDISGDDSARAKMIERTGGPKSVPQIFIDDKHYGGWDDIYALDSQGKLDGILMADLIKVACIQMNSDPDMAVNLRDAEIFIRQAAEQGAKLIATPENTDSMCFPASVKLENTATQDEHRGVEFFASLACELDVWLLIGSMSIKSDEGGKLYNRSFLFANDGSIAASYDKIHLFDVDLSTGESHCESDFFNAGSRAVTCQTPFLKIGFNICYDIRFANLQRDLAKAGAQILSVPAAFTVPTGCVHWEILLRARAIETGCFVIAPAQVGEHAGGRKTYGHSMIIDPWGTVLADAGGENPCIIMADLDLNKIKDVRGSIPALKHDRKYEVYNVE